MRMDRRSDSGFTLIELFAVIALMACGTAMAIMMTQGASKVGKADSGAKLVASVLRKARESAIAKRRNMKVVFNLTANTMQIVRVEYNWTVTPITAVDNVEQTIPLEGGVQFLKYSGITAYPISTFPTSTAAVTFTQVSSAPTVLFTPEGFALDPVTNNPMDGTIFLGRPNEQDTARALTMTGVTALVERWTYRQTAWVSAR